MAAQPNACFELCSGETWRAPWPMYAALRDADPAHHVEPGDYWVLSRYSDVQTAVLDPARYSSASGLTVSYGDRAAAGLTAVTPLVMMDPPGHTEFRALISRGYTPRRVAEIEPAVRRFVRARLDAIADLGACDIVAELFRPVPSFVVAGYLGVPEADRAQFDRWTHGIVDANAAAGPTQAADAAAELFGYFSTLIERRRTEPADDTISDLARLMDGDVAGLLRILGFAFTMIAGGNDTVTGLLGGAAELLTSHPAQRRLLLDRPGPAARGDRGTAPADLAGPVPGPHADQRHHRIRADDPQWAQGPAALRVGQPRPARVRRQRGRVRHPARLAGRTPAPGLRHRPAPLPGRRRHPAAGPRRAAGTARPLPALRR